MSTIQLQFPIQVNGEEVEELNLRRPRVRDRILVEKTGSNTIEKEVQLLANLCEVSPKVIEELDMVDYLKLQEELSHFLS